MNQIENSPTANGCRLCGATNVALTGTALSRRCSKSSECAVRARNWNAERPNLAVVPTSMTGFEHSANLTPAQAMIALSQKKAGLHLISGPIDFGDEFSLPIDAAQGRYVLFGKTGCGKSNASAVIVEACFNAGIPVCIIDPLGNMWGLRYAGSGNGIAIPIIGGTHGDLPLRLEDAKRLAEILGEGQSMLLDLSDLQEHEQQMFVCEFFAVLRRVLHRPTHVVVEEADYFAPSFSRSKSHFASQGSIYWFSKQIRNRGVGWTFSTQAMQQLNSVVINSANAFIAMQTTGDAAQRIIGRETGSRVGQAVASAILSELGGMSVGDAWLIPDSSLLDTSVAAPVKFRFRQRRTWNSTQIPRIGKPLNTPPTPVGVDLAAFSGIKAQSN
jgi:hypothetical protein